MPEDAFVKQWSLVLNGGRLWLCITVLVHRDHKPVDPKNTLTAGVDLRWRTLEPGVHLVASIHDPVMDASHDITIRFDDSNTKGDKSFPESDPRRVRNNTLLSIEEMCCIKMGLGRQSQRDLRHWARNNGLPSEDDDIPAALAAVRERHQAETDAIKSFVSTVEGATRSTISGIRAEVLTYIETTRDEYLFLDTYLDIVDLQARQSQLIELTKAYVMAHIRLFEPKSKSMLSWLPNVGMPKLQDIARGSSIDITLTRDVMEVLQIWSQTNQKLGRWLTYVHQWLAARKRYGYEIAADAIVRYLKSKNVMRINFETAIVKGLSESVDQYSPYGIRYSQHFRQWIGPGGFSSILERFAKKHGLIVEHVVPANTTRKCRHCGHINVVGASLTFRCARCTRMMGADVLLNQTHNAAANISKPKQFRKPVGRSDRKPPRTKAAKLGT